MRKRKLKISTASPKHGQNKEVKEKSNLKILNFVLIGILVVELILIISFGITGEAIKKIVSSTNPFTISINVKDSFFEGEMIYFDYQIYSDKNYDLTYLAHVECPNAPISLLNFQEYEIKKGETLRKVYEDIKIDQSIEPQVCTAYAEILKPFTKRVEKKFKIETKPSFEFIVSTCKDLECKEKSKIFLKGEKLYLGFSDTQIPNNVKMIAPDKSEITYRPGLILDKLGTYTLSVSASKEGYKDLSEKTEFGVIDTHLIIKNKEFVGEIGGDKGNVKNMGQYTNGEIFLISDKNWKDVMKLVPVTTWTDGDVVKYPTLIYHEQEEIHTLNLTESILNIIYYNNQAYIKQISPYTYLSPVGPYSYVYTENACNDPSWNEVYTINKYFSPNVISVGENTSLYVANKNCGQEEAYLFNLFLTDFVYSYPGSFDVVEDTIPVNRMLAPDEEVNVSFDFTFNNPLPSSFDADSIIYFIQQYNPSKVTIVGNSSQELNDLLIAAPPFGGGLIQGQIQRITPNNYTSYWSNYDDVVLVEDAYELALIASAYASLINAPLVIEEEGFDFNGKNVIVVGNATCPQGASGCTYFNTKEQLEEEYISLTDTDKIVLVNYNDLNISLLERNFYPQRSNKPIYNIYTKNSLAAPFLASAKHELIISTNSIEYDQVDSFIDNKIDSLGINPEYLTIVASPNTIDMQFSNENMSMCYYGLCSADQWYYSKINDVDPFLDLAVGRIFGLTISDTSSNIARSLFYEETLKNENKALSTRGAICGADAANVYTIGKVLEKVGYETTITPEGTQASDWENKFFIIYLDHGIDTWLGINYDEIPYLDNTFIVTQACSTCAFEKGHYKGGLICSNVLRKGGIAYIGATDTAGYNNIPGLLSEIFSKGSTIGESFRNSKNSVMVWDSHINGDPSINGEINGMSWYTLIGDPTLKIKTIHTFPKTNFGIYQNPTMYNLIVQAMKFEIPPEVQSLCQGGCVGPYYFSTAFNRQLDIDYSFTTRFQLYNLNTSLITNEGWYADQEFSEGKSFYWITSPYSSPGYFLDASNISFTDYSFLFPKCDLLGDVNYDGIIDCADVQWILEMAVGLRPIDMCGDISGDGNVTAYDASLLMQQYNLTCVCSDGTPYGQCNASGYRCVDGQLYLFGDVNNDGKVNVGDLVYLINYLYKNGPAPLCTPITSCGDVNLDGKVNVGDLVYLINYLYKNGPAPCNSIQNPPAPLTKTYTEVEANQLLKDAQSQQAKAKIAVK